MDAAHHTQMRAESKVSNGWKNSGRFFQSLEKPSNEDW
jgi:hypothetical protein